MICWSLINFVEGKQAEWIQHLTRKTAKSLIRFLASFLIPSWTSYSVFARCLWMLSSSVQNRRVWLVSESNMSFSLFLFYFFLIVSICWYVIVDLFYTEKPTQKFAGRVKLDQAYDEEYNDINSPRSRALITVLDSKLKPFFKKKFSDFIDINYKSFFKGSVGVDYELLFPATSTLTDGNIVQALGKGNGSSELGFLRLTGDITVTKQVVQTTAAPTATKGKLQCLFIFYVAFMLLAFKEVQCNLTCIKVFTTLSVLLH